MTDTEGASDAPDASQAPVTKLSPKDRRKRISDRVLAEGQVTIEELVQELGVSQMTVHRDLDTLEHQGWLRKVRGGATAAPSALFESTARWRGNEQVAAKEAICEAALALAEPGQAVIIDDSSTALLVDHSKFGRQARYELAPLADFDLVISDEHLPQEEQEALQSLGVRYELATVGSRRG
ncbi:DeoR/GlpR family DNA-binding transcription regulator [Streptomyces noursei]|uniref:DeoR/GlpR family DNA-binding transcription regulator n=1 Tax=Streptomyces noursei TaxID=1971 RepID=UPI003800104A